MTSTSSQPGQFEPIHNAHAIEQVMFTVQVSDALDDEQLSEIEQLCSTFTELPAKQALAGVFVGVGSGPFPFSMGGPNFPNTVSGYTLQNILPNGTVESELRVDRWSVMFRTVTYTRWQAVWERARKYFGAALPIYAQNAQFTAIGLNYIDKFIWNGAPELCRARSLLRSGSPYFSPHLLDVDDLWHSYTGAFLRPDDATKRLLNVNIDCLDEAVQGGGRRVVVITTALTDMLNQAGFDATAITVENVLPFVESRLGDMHVLEKNTLNAIINDKMNQRIGLEAT